jgi:hypothetical protein
LPGKCQNESNRIVHRRTCANVAFCGDSISLMATPQAVPRFDYPDTHTDVEPTVRIEISVPRECVDGVSFTLMGRRARVEAEEVHGTTHIMHVEMAVGDMVGFASELRVRTQGRASYHTPGINRDRTRS